MPELTSSSHTPLQAYAVSNSMYHMNTLPGMVQFLHRALFRPVLDTWCNAINAGYLTTWPGLTYKLVRKHLPKSIYTAKVHLRLSRQHFRSTSAQLPLAPPPPSHTPTYDEGRNSPHGEPSPRNPGMYEAGKSVRSDIYRSNRHITQGLQQGEQVGDGAVLLRQLRHPDRNFEKQHNPRVGESIDADDPIPDQSGPQALCPPH